MELTMVDLVSPKATGGTESWVSTLVWRGMDLRLATAFASVAYEEPDRPPSVWRIRNGGDPKVGAIWAVNLLGALKPAVTDWFEATLVAHVRSGLLPWVIVPTGCPHTWRLE